jgi:hypothetical protein
VRWFDRLGIALAYTLMTVAALLVAFVIWQVL